MEPLNEFWIPDNRWSGQDVFIVGGGPSLRTFDMDRLSGLNVIGCNEAFILGPRLVQGIFFSDAKWFVRRNRELEEYCNRGGSVFTHEEALRFHNLPWLKVLKRSSEHLSTDSVIFGRNSGSGAINLALLLGARRVFLLGFDCKQSDNKQHNNWHDNYKKYHRATFVPPFHNFIYGMLMVSKTLNQKFPGCEVINLGPDSALDVFPKKHVDDILPVLSKV